MGPRLLSQKLGRFLTGVEIYPVWRLFDWRVRWLRCCRALRRVGPIRTRSAT